MTPFTAQLNQLLSDVNVPDDSAIPGFNIFHDELGEFPADFNFDAFSIQNLEGLRSESPNEGPMFTLYEDSAAHTGIWNKELADSVDAFLEAERAKDAASGAVVGEIVDDGACSGEEVA